MIARLDGKIEEQTRPFQKPFGRMREVPGIERRVAENVLAEFGADRKPFPTDGQVASCSGICAPAWRVQ